MAKGSDTQSDDDSFVMVDAVVEKEEDSKKSEEEAIAKAEAEAEAKAAAEAEMKKKAEEEAAKKSEEEVNKQKREKEAELANQQQRSETEKSMDDRLDAAIEGQSQEGLEKAIAHAEETVTWEWESDSLQAARSLLENRKTEARLQKVVRAAILNGAVDELQAAVRRPTTCHVHKMRLERQGTGLVR